MEKCHKQDVAPIEQENERDENYKSDNPQIDSSKTKYNYHMHNIDGTYTEFINQRITELNLSPRKDAVVMNSFVVGADKAFFDGLSKLSQYNFFSDCTKFFEERYGMENVISAVIHMDETTLHMHLNLVPITPDGRLCSKDLFDKPKLRQLQTDFYNAVGKEDNRTSRSDTGGESSLCGRSCRGEKRRYSPKARTVARTGRCFNGRE